MKVVHVLKKIESIDSDIKDLRKMEKSLQQNKSFTTPIYLSIEKQINILLGDRIKLLELRIENPPESMIEPEEEVKKEAPAPARRTAGKKARTKKAQAPAAEPVDEGEDFDDDDIPLMTQDLIDKRINSIRKDSAGNDSSGSDSVKLLDIALEKGTISKAAVEKEKKKVKFFKDNFPGGEY